MILLTAVLLNILVYLLIQKEFRQRAKQIEKPKGVSVIIAARNEQSNLEMLLPKILEQDHPDFEVIIADDRSTDSTPQILAAMAEKHPRLKVVTISRQKEDWSPKKFALSQAVKQSVKPVLLFTDADCLVRPGWITAMTRQIGGETEIVLGFSPVQREDGLLNLLIRFENFQTGFLYMGLAGLGFPYMGVGRNLCASRAFWEENNGMKEHKSLLSGDDDLFVNRAASGVNTKIELSPESLVLTKGETSLKKWIRQKRRHLSTGYRYKGATLSVIGLFHLANLLFYGALLLELIQANFVNAGILAAVRFLIIGWIYRRTFSGMGIRFPGFGLAAELLHLLLTMLIVVFSRSPAKWK